MNEMMPYMHLRTTTLK